MLVAPPSFIIKEEVVWPPGYSLWFPIFMLGLLKKELCLKANCYFPAYYDIISGGKLSIKYSLMESAVSVTCFVDDYINYD